MKDIVEVNTGEVKFGSGKVVLRSLAIGSCIAVVAYDRKRRAGAMAHIMLPGEAPENAPNKTKYASNAIDAMIEGMVEGSSQVSDIEVCLVGAGNVLEKEDDTICDANIKSVTSLLKERKIPVREAVLGGIKRKNAFLNIADGKVFYVEGDGEAECLWKSTVSK